MIKYIIKVNNPGKREILITLIALCMTLLLPGQSLEEIEAVRVKLPNGWNITPIGNTLPLGDLPLNIAVSPSGRMIAVTNNGVGVQSVQLFDAVKNKLLDSVVMSKAWLGLEFSSDGRKLYASGGNDNMIVIFDVSHKKLIPADTIVLGKKWPEKISVAGIAADDSKKVIYAVTKENNSLYVADIMSKKVLKRLPLEGEGYTCILSPDKKTLYVSCWGCDRIKIFDTEKQEFTGYIPVGDNPNDMCITKSGKYLYVANANDNSVSLIDLVKKEVIEVLNTALYNPAPAGSTANSLALGEDEETLYIANADNNCLAVFNVSEPGESKSMGFIPAGWYPTCVRIIKDRIYIANGKGFSSMANPDGPSPDASRVEYQKSSGIKEQYIGSLFRGRLTIIKSPDEEQLRIFTQAVFDNTPYSKDKEYISEGAVDNPVPMKVGDKSPIKYIFYIIKENRTYDQVLGDIPEGDGDSSLVLFGENISPNHHALAREFVLLDNFYVNGEVSADGHNWSTGAYATDYLEKTWPTSYGGRGGSYDAEGNREIANNKNGFIWDNCRRNGVSYRTYGEFADNYKANIPVLMGHFCTYFTGWDQNIRDTTRFYQWKNEFDSLLSAGSIPQLNTLRFINDHTEGLRKGRPTPFAHMADNDLAIGLFVEHLSHSSIWNESAVFIVEDDAQNGPDHVDAHRSVALVAGGFVKKGYVDHTMYSTASILRTIELILGLPPMSQYDAAARPMWRCFAPVADHPAYNARQISVDLNEKNNVDNRLSQLSETFDFSKEDRCPDLEFNKVIWAAVKGENVLFPAPRRAAFFRQGEEDDDD